jgi:DNA-binding NtrC family response regulator
MLSRGSSDVHGRGTFALLAEDDHVDVPTLEELVGVHPLGSFTRDIDALAKSILALPVRRGSKLDVVQRAVLHHAIETCGGNKSAAARLIGVDRKVLDRRWDRLSEEQSASSAHGANPGSSSRPPVE